MMLAYRRGLLEPDYKYGLQSMIREKMVMEMLDDEQTSETVKLAAILRCMAIAPAIKPESAVEFADSFKRSVLRSIYLSEYSKVIPDLPEENVSATADNLIRAFNMLKERGIIEEFRERAVNAFKDLEEDSE